MSGQIRGKIECLMNTGNRQALNQVFFKNLYDYFSTHPNYTLISLQYGLTGSNVPGSTSSGTGTGYYDQANSFGYNAFFVTRANATIARPFDVYYLFQWAGSSAQAGANTAIGAAIGPGNPALVNGLSSPFNDNNHPVVMMQCAIGVGGNTGTTLSPNNGNPWKGTQNGNGLDLKQQVGPIWSAPSGGGTGVMVFPRSNSGGTPNGGGLTAGAFISKAQNGCYLFSSNGNTDVQQTRMHIVGDDDSFCIFADFVDNSNYYMPAYCGLYTPRPNIGNGQVITYPFCCFNAWNNIPFVFTAETTYGDVAGTSLLQGGISMVTTASVGQMQIDHLVSNFLVDANYWPDHQLPGTVYNEFPIAVGVFEATPVPQSGYMGQLTFIKEMFNVPTNDVKSDFSRIFVGSTTLAQSKVSIPWDSQNNTVPRSGATRTGITFVTNLGKE